METMNYNRHSKKNSKAGIIGFMLFACLGGAASAYMIINEPEPNVIGQDFYIPVDSENVDIYGEQKIDLDAIEYSVKSDISTSKSGKFSSSIATPKIIVDGEELTDINNEIFLKFSERYAAVKSDIGELEHTFTYKVTFNKYETKLEENRFLSFTFYERIIDDSKGTDVTYKLYAYTIDLGTKKIVSQEDAAIAILGSTYKTIIKDNVKEFVLAEKLFTEESYNYVLTGLEEFYVKDGELHIMFNPDEMGENEDYLDIVIEK